MTTVIVYDSIFGNTATIARAIAAGRSDDASVRLLSPTEARSLELAAGDLLIVGSPTRGFAATPAINEFLAGLSSVPAGIRAAAFDTRLAPETVHPAPLRWVVEAGGYAAKRIAEVLRQKGFAVAADEGGFAVQGTEGPLKPGEVERAETWARALP